MGAQIGDVGHPAFQDQRELAHIGRVHYLAGDRSQSGVLELVLVLAGNDAKVIGFLDELLRWHADGERLTVHQIVIGVADLPHGYGHTRRFR